VDRIAERPLTGAGFGRGAMRDSFRVEFGDPTFWHAHNTVLNYGLALGVGGVILILAIFASVLGALIQTLRERDPEISLYALAAVAMLIGMFAKNLTDDLFIRQSALLYWAIAGMVLGASARRRSP
jgi:O-antigen ligase